MDFLRFFNLSILIFVFAETSVVHAQVDASAQLLLSPSENAKPNATGLQSGRYKIKSVKKLAPLPAKKIPELDSRNTGSTPVTTVVLPPTPLGQMLFTPPQTQPDIVSLPIDPLEIPPMNEDQPAVADQVKDLVMGKDLPAVEAYKEQIHPDDTRLNQIEINVLPGVIANSSKSSYSFRNYNSFAPKILVGAEFWLTPFMGIYGSYTTSMGADIIGDPTTNSRIPVQHEWTEIGIDLRRYFGMSRKSNSLEYGIHISEYKFIVPGDDLHRVTLKSTGIGIHLSARIPVAPTYSWIFGGKFIPRVQHSEKETGIALSSGSPGESTRFDLSLGGELKLRRQNQFIWDLTLSFEKNHFAGEASLADPETGAKPKGVSVENIFTIFSLGYRWGQ